MRRENLAVPVRLRKQLIARSQQLNMPTKRIATKNFLFFSHFQVQIIIALSLDNYLSLYQQTTCLRGVIIHYSTIIKDDDNNTLMSVPLYT